MKEQLDYNIRCGKHINVAEELDELESKFRADLKGTIDTYDCMDDVSNESLNDLILFTTVIRVMNKFGYIDDEECKNICEYAAKIRLEKLDELTAEPIGGASNE